ncbi:methyltransferase domain-containing protein [Polaromonas sp.]|uniref:SAM-dependent methyltransferase n=1 Tax=Polaromonas sp. TaxID=1869339 RepID=UPI0025FD20CC|nr:methyltransferase domain-containing protein [Polaromonas sp.]
MTTHAQAQTLEEVPFITSPDKVTLEMLSIAGVQRGDHVIDLGSGDGRIVILAARKFEATGLGVEIDPTLVEKSKANARNAGVADRTEFRLQDLFKTDLAPASVITMYLLPEYNLQLRPKLLALKPGTRIVSHDWDMGDWKPDRTTVVAVPDKAVGREKSSKVHLWTVPARVDGLWCASGLLRGASIRLTQTYQTFTGTLGWGKRTRELAGTISGSELRTPAGSSGELVLQAADDVLRISAAQGNMALAQGASFRRAAGTSCD